MDETGYKLLLAYGAFFCLLGLVVFAAAQYLVDRPEQVPPECEISACPSHPGPDPRFAGVVLIILGFGIIVGAAAIGVDAPFSRSDEELMLERIERIRRRID